MKYLNYLLRFLFVVLFISVSFMSCSCKKDSKTTVTQPPVVTVDTPKTYKLVWSDEFDSTDISVANWNFETGGNGWGNHEKEYYQKDNASVAGGNLIITAKKETVGSNNYTSSRMTTLAKREFTYGKIEARIRIPVGQGLWPAFWLLGANINTVNWPECGETDIMEHINTDSLLYGTLHWNNNGHVSSGNKVPVDSIANFHVYTIEWDAKSIHWSVDSTDYHQVDITGGINNTGTFQKPFFIILNLAVGGDWPGQTIDEAKLPANMYVDWVRVYQKL
jgi:beta-glucanase (GH16 family)